MASSQTPQDILGVYLGQLQDLIGMNEGAKAALSIVQDWAK